MNIKKNILNYISNFILIGLTSFSFVLALCSSLNFAISSSRLVFINCIFSAIFYMIFFNKKTLIASGILTGATAIYFFSYILYKEKTAEIFSQISRFYFWIVNYIIGEEPLNLKFEFYLIILLCFIITLIVYIFTQFKFNFFIILIGGISIFVSQWILDFFSSYTAFYTFILIVVIYYFKFIYIRNFTISENEFAEPGVFTLWLIPVSLAILVISVSLPTRSSPIVWEWLDVKINTMVNYFNNNFQYQTFDYFSISSTGFGNDNSNLGGKVKLNKTIVLEVDAPRRVYLKGNSNDFYTGNSWISTDKSSLSINNPVNKLRLDISDMSLGIPVLSNNRNYLDKYFNTDLITVTFRNLKTKSIFTPVKPSKISFIENGSPNSIVYSNGFLASDRMLDRNFKYSIESYAPKYDDEEFKDLLRKSKKGLYYDLFYNSINQFNRMARIPAITWDSKANRYVFNVSNENSNLSSNNTYGRLKSVLENTNEIYSKYTQLPDTLPQRVRDMAASLTSAASNDYDRVKAIELHLSRNYPYTLSPKSTPKGKDFVDYFLFDLKQGYCTYYASAMTVLLRCTGIPSRYVEGYILPSMPTADTTYQITNEQAHAWVEVYFEGFGWMPFEPTSPFISSFYNDQTYSPVFSDEFLEDPEMQDYLNSLQGMSDMVPFDEEDTNGTGIDKKINIKFMSFVLFLIAATLLLVTILVNAFKRRLRSFRYSKMPPNDAVLQIYKYLVILLSLTGLSIKPGETASQFSQRVDNNIYFLNVKFKNITDIFMVARYSTISLSENEKSTLLEFSKVLADKVKKELGKFKFFIYSFILGKI